MSADDLQQIVQGTWPCADPRLVEFNGAVHDRACVVRDVGQVGAPWEFNLRDVFRCASVSPDLAVDLVYMQRFRNRRDRDTIVDLYRRVFDTAPIRVTHAMIQIMNDTTVTFTDLQTGLYRLYQRPSSSIV